MKYSLLVLSVFFIIAIICIAAPSNVNAQTGFFHPEEAAQETGFRQGAPTNKTWLILIGTLAGFALMFLLVLEIGGGGLFPHKLEDFVAKFCIGIIATALCLYAYYMTENILFIVLIPFAIAAIMFVYFKKAIKRVYMKKLGQPSAPNLWICRKCGAENSMIINECHSCNSIRAEHVEQPAKNVWQCENCKYENTVDDKSCRRCGMRRKENN
jgi:ribosomal protein L40E